MYPQSTKNEKLNMSATQKQCFVTLAYLMRYFIVIDVLLEFLFVSKAFVACWTSPLRWSRDTEQPLRIGSSLMFFIRLTNYACFMLDSQSCHSSVVVIGKT